MSGWGKAAAVGSTATVYEGEKPYFGMLAAVYYTGVSGEEWHLIPFSKDYTDWQFASGIVVPKAYNFRSKNDQGIILGRFILLMADKAPSRGEDLAKHAQRQGGGDAYIRVRGV